MLHALPVLHAPTCIGRPCPSLLIRPSRRRPFHEFQATSSTRTSPPAPEPEVCTSPTPNGTSCLDDIPPAKLKELRRQGLAIKDTIKLGRRGVAEGFIVQVFQRWNTSEVAKLYCHGKHAANMKLLTQQLEERTGGIVVHKAGGSVFLYRAEPWPRQPPPLPDEPPVEAVSGMAAAAGSQL